MGIFWIDFLDLSTGPFPQVKDARQRCEKVQEENREMALENSDLEPQFTERKENLRKLVTEAQDLQTGYEEEYQELSELNNYDVVVI